MHALLALLLQQGLTPMLWVRFAVSVEACSGQASMQSSDVVNDGHGTSSLETWTVGLCWSIVQFSCTKMHLWSGVQYIDQQPGGLCIGWV